MGRQVRFYTTASDETTFLEYLRETGDIHVYGSCSPTPEPQEFDSFAEFVSPSANFRPHAYLWNGALSTPIKTREVREQSLHCIDTNASDVIEFSPSRVTDKGVWRGRLYVDPMRLADGQIVWKPKALLDWHAELAKWIRRRYAYDRALQAYVAPGAAELAAQGVPLK